MQSSITIMSRSFQLSPLTADRNSRADIPFTGFGFAVITVYPWARQISSLRSRSF